ncbi:hypothetical protein L2E82_26742 [Cichorium intybus]|uniref:Uncharacterized protein n=1 Tax=Cichorium intybus TaxID=13427 RepID=A0ACB9CR51_CICIN|nr:hypothetical protein L2E82_26742 [Cichorium intybus]
MVAISLYKCNLHRAPNPFRQWLMPTPEISLKDFKTLLHRRSRALSRLQSTNDTTSNPNLDHSGREQHQSAGYLEDIGKVGSALKVYVEKPVGELAIANDDENGKKGSMGVDDFLVGVSGESVALDVDEAKAVVPKNHSNAAGDGFKRKSRCRLRRNIH